MKAELKHFICFLINGYSRNYAPVTEKARSVLLLNISLSPWGIMGLYFWCVTEIIQG